MEGAEKATLDQKIGGGKSRVQKNVLCLQLCGVGSHEVPGVGAWGSALERWVGPDCQGRDDRTQPVNTPCLALTVA